ncbi:hypothetical protein ACFRAQ_35105 [Nocardia sp. NPDC056611]|uniref:hypothetical protein n=1 Tax=Nocardia sp. NPDC056611 TaxID=3345877 RepID=UPI00366F52DC
MSAVVFPVTVVSPDKREAKAHNPVELNNLVAHGYVVKTVPSAPVSAPEPPAKASAAAEPRGK